MLIMSFRIQHLQWAGFIGVTAICVVVALLTIAPKLSDYFAAQQTMSKFSRLNAVLEAAAVVSAERGPANNFMSATSDREQYRKALAAARARTDASMKRAADLLFADAARRDEVRTDFESAEAELADGRRLVDNAKIDSDLGKGVEVASAIEAMFSAADRMQELGNAVGRAVIGSDPSVAIAVTTATTASGLREHAGRLGSYIVMMLVSNRGAGSSYLTSYHSELARVRDLYAFLGNYAPTLTPRNDVSFALLAARKSYFEGSLVYAGDVVERLGTSRAPSSTEFTVKYVPGMLSTETLRNVILANGADAASEAQSNALRMVLISLLLSVTEVAAMLAIAWTVNRVLFRPLLLVRRQIDEIAKGNIADDPSAAYRGGGLEIREIFRGLSFLRDQLRRKSELEDERQKMATELKRQSDTDALTGLLNRRALMSVVATLASQRELRGAGIGVIMFDIDRFKSINDRFGHAVGDRVLARITGLLAPSLRDNDCFARYGGEEFVVVLRDIEEAELGLAAERLRVRLDGAVVVEEIQDGVTASFGAVWCGPDAVVDWESIIRVADERLYRAKSSGRNAVCSSEPDLIESDSIVPFRRVTTQA